MVWTGVPTAVLLLSLLSGTWEVEDQELVDLGALNHIVSLINEPTSGTSSVPEPGTFSEDDLQYAMAIRIAKEQCLQGFQEEGFKCLKKEVKEIRNRITNRSMFYEGETAVAARPDKARHSEYRLLIEHNPTVVEKLLEKAKGQSDDCVIFYTYNSPCCDMCLNEKEDKVREIMHSKKQKKPGNTDPLIQKCIYNYTKVLTSLGGPRAFVFTQLYRKDVEKNKKDKKNKEVMRAAFKKIDDRVPLYQCDNNRCQRCEANNKFCVHDDDQNSETLIG